MVSCTLPAPPDSPRPNSPRPASSPTHSTDDKSYDDLLKDTYDEVVHWKKNCFKIPLGNAGKSFVTELSRLYSAFAEGSAIESTALMAAMVLPILLLQNPHKRSKTKEHIACLERRMKSWKCGDLLSLVKEGRSLQQRLPKFHSGPSDHQISRSFANLMFKGKTHAALLSNNGKGGVLHIDDKISESSSNSTTVRDVLISKHPLPKPATAASSLDSVPPEVHPILFDGIDAPLIRKIALKTKGAAGPSGLDAYAWRRLCTAFKSASSSLT